VSRIGQRCLVNAGTAASWIRAPGFWVLLIAPFLGEALSTSTPPLTLLLPPTLVLQAALYGGGLGAAYGVLEEALLVRSWFNPHFEANPVGDAYSRIWHTNLLLAVHLTLYHAVVSIGCSVLLVELAFRGQQHRAWCGRRGLLAAGIGLALLGVLSWLPGGFYRAPAPQAIAAAAIAVGLVYLARRAARTALPSPSRPLRPRLGLLAFACTGAHFGLVWALPSLGWPWPIGITAALTPPAVGLYLGRRMALRGFGPARRGRSPPGRSRSCCRWTSGWAPPAATTSSSPPPPPPSACSCSATIWPQRSHPLPTPAPPTPDVRRRRGRDDDAALLAAVAAPVQPPPAELFQRGRARQPRTRVTGAISRRVV
jgi:hypothetical protein